MEANGWITQAVGWVSSGLLLATIARQLVTQWQAGESRGVSPWLFVGQTGSSLGFVIYSVLLENWVFTITNSLLLISGLVGCWITYWLRAHPRKPG